MAAVIFPRRVLRSDPDADSQYVAAVEWPWPWSATTVLQEALDWRPVRWNNRIAVNIDDGDFAAYGVLPRDGGVTPAQGAIGSNQIKLHANSEAQVGMIVLLQSDTVGNGLGKWGFVNAVGGGQVVDIVDPFNNNYSLGQNAAGGQVARLLMPSFLASRVFIRTEFGKQEVSAGVPLAVRFGLYFYGLPVDMAGALTMSLATPDGIHRLRATELALDRGESGTATAVHGDVLVRDAIPGIGYKLEVLELPAAGTDSWVSIWTGCA